MGDTTSESEKLSDKVDAKESGDLHTETGATRA